MRSLLAGRGWIRQVEALPARVARHGRLRAWTGGGVEVEAEGAGDIARLLDISAKAPRRGAWHHAGVDRQQAAVRGGGYGAPSNGRAASSSSYKKMFPWGEGVERDGPGAGGGSVAMRGRGGRGGSSKKIVARFRDLAHQGDKMGRSDLLSEVRGSEQAMVEALRELDAADLATIIYCYATMGILPEAGVLKMLGGAVLSRIEACGEKELGKTIWGYASLRMLPPEALLRAHEKQTAARMDEFSAQAISNSMWAYARLGIKPGAAMLGRLERRAVSQISHFTALHLGMLLWSFAALDIVPREGLMRGMEAQASFLVGSFDPMAIATTMWSFSQLRIRPGEGLLAGLEGQAAARIQDFDARETATVLWAYAELGMRPGRELMLGLESRMLAEVETYTSRDLAFTLWACAVLGGGGTDGLIDAACRRAMSHVRGDAHSVNSKALGGAEGVNIGSGGGGGGGGAEGSSSSGGGVVGGVMKGAGGSSGGGFTADERWKLHLFLLVREAAAPLQGSSAELREAIGSEFACEEERDGASTLLKEDIVNTLKARILDPEPRIPNPEP
jgi:hypothetical protein